VWRPVCWPPCMRRVHAMPVCPRAHTRAHTRAHAPAHAHAARGGDAGAHAVCTHAPGGAHLLGRVRLQEPGERPARGDCSPMQPHAAPMQPPCSPHAAPMQPHVQAAPQAAPQPACSPGCTPACMHPRLHPSLHAAQAAPQPACSPGCTPAALRPCASCAPGLQAHVHASQVRAQRKADTAGPTEGSAEEARKREGDEMAIALPQEGTRTMQHVHHAHGRRTRTACTCTRDMHTRTHAHAVWVVASLLTTADGRSRAAELSRAAGPGRHEGASAGPPAAEHHAAAQRPPPRPLSGDDRTRTADRGGRGPDPPQARARGAPRAVEAAERRAGQARGHGWAGGCRWMGRLDAFAGARVGARVGAWAGAWAGA
jgi:hypothetical protein